MCWLLDYYEFGFKSLWLKQRTNNRRNSYFGSPKWSTPKKESNFPSPQQKHTGEAEGQVCVCPLGLTREQSWNGEVEGMWWNCAWDEKTWFPVFLKLTFWVFVLLHSHHLIEIKGKIGTIRTARARGIMRGRWNSKDRKQGVGLHLKYETAVFFIVLFFNILFFYMQ